MQEIERTAEDALRAPHYLRAVTTLGDAQPIETNQDIYAEGGMKLLARGAKFDSSVYDRLLRHKLMPPLDECLAIENPVTGDGLSRAIHALLERDAQLQRILPFMPPLAEISGWLLDVPLNPAMAFKLTVMREQRPELFRHSLYIALLSLYLGFRSGLARHRLIELATAALLHDIGILHIDPALLDRARRLSTAERRHLYAHPLAAWLLVRTYPAYSNDVLKGILQHHERMDGSGYPKGLAGDEIDLYGRIIAVAEIVASRYDTDTSRFEWLRLETILKLNARRYGQELIGYLNIFRVADESVPPCGEPERAVVREKLFRISAALSAWRGVREMLRAEDAPVASFAATFLENLEIGLLDAGLNPYAVEKNALGMEEGGVACFEARILLDEAEWQLRGLVQTLRRRSAELARLSAPSQAALHEWVEDVERVLQVFEENR